MDRVKKRLAHMLVVVLMFALIAPAAPSVTASAATKKTVKNPVTELGIKELPEGNTLRVGDVFNFNPDIIATERGKGKTTGLVWWEVNAETNTAGVSSSRWGYVYPVYAGSFEIRALAFANTKDLNAWKAARKANGNVADEAAMAKYTTAASDWVKIDVVGDKEGYAVARTQYQLNLALKNKKATDVHIVTDKPVHFVIASRNYTNRTLTVDAPNAEVENAGRFAQINIKQIKASTFTEKAYGNRFHVTAPNARLVLLNKGGTKEVVFEPEESAKDPYIIIVGEGGRLHAPDVAAPGKVEISGVLIGEARHNAVVVNVAEEAAGTSIQTEVALEVNAASDVAVTVEKAKGSENVSDASETVINMEKVAKVAVDGSAANGTTVVVKGQAKGSEIASDAALIIIADADVTLNLTENAAGTTVTKGENVKVKLSAQSSVDGVKVTDPNGKVETVKPGEDSPEVTVAPSATPTPSTIPTTTPSGGSSGWTPSYPSNTPAPTQAPANSMSYSVGDKTEDLSFGEGSKETVIVLPADSQLKMLTLTINGANTQKTLAVGINAVSVGGYTVKFIVPLAALRVSASLSDVKLSTDSSSVVTGSAVLVVKVLDDLSAFMGDPDFTVSYEWKVDGTVLSDVSGTSYQKEVEVTAKDGVVTYAEPEVYSVAADVKHGKTGNAISMQSNSLQIDISQEKETWFEEQGLTFSPQGNFGFMTSTEDETQEATIDEIYTPANIVIKESTEGVEEGYKTVTALIYFNTKNIDNSAGNIWTAYVSVFDRYTGTAFNYFNPDEYLPSPPLSDGDKEESTYSMAISYNGKTYDISGEKISQYNARTYMTTVKIVCPVDYDGVVFAVGKNSPELQKQAMQLPLEQGQKYTVDLLPHFGKDYFYFSAKNPEYNNEYCGIYQEWLEKKGTAVLIYSVSGGELTGELRGEIALEAPGYYGDDDYVYNIYQDYYACPLPYNCHTRGAVVTATILGTEKTGTVKLEQLGNVLQVGEYDINFLSLTDAQIPTAVSAQYNTLRNTNGEDEATVEVVLSAQFEDVSALECRGGLFGIRWHDSEGNILGEASWQKSYSYEESSSWHLGGGEGWGYDFPYSVTQEEGGKIVNCKVSLPVSKAPKADDINGYYAFVFFEGYYYMEIERYFWWTMPPKMVIENTVDGGLSYAETPRDKVPELFHTHLSLWDSEGQTVTDSNYTAFDMADGTKQLVFHVADESDYKYLWYDTETQSYSVYAEEPVSKKVAEQFDITQGMINYSPEDKTYRFAAATDGGKELEAALAISKPISADTYISVLPSVKGYLLVFDSVTDTCLYAIDTKKLDWAGKRYEFKKVPVSEEASELLINFVDGELEVLFGYPAHINPTFLVSWSLPDVLIDEWIAETDYVTKIILDAGHKETFEVGLETVRPFKINWDGKFENDIPLDFTLKTAQGMTYTKNFYDYNDDEWEYPENPVTEVTFTNIPDTAQSGEIVTVTMTVEGKCSVYFAGDYRGNVTSEEFRIAGNGRYWYYIKKDGKISMGYLDITCFQ